MPGKNRTDKPNNPRLRHDTDVSGIEKAKNRNQTNISDRNTGEINRRNTVHTGHDQQSNELHTNESVTGSDSGGQPE